jgi:iron complex transport system substrate-binding protein
LRIVSLLPSATEIVAALGLGDELVGRSHECDFPPGVEALPVLTAPRLDPSGSSREIHEAVMRSLEDTLSVYMVDSAGLAALSPTHVVTQVHCEVCAVSLAEVSAATASWPRAPVIVTLGASTLEGVLEDFRRVGDALEVGRRGEELIGAVRARMARVAERATSSTASTSHTAAGVARRPRVAAIEWLDPLMAAGNWIPEMIEMAGGESVFGRPGAHSEWISAEELVRADPDVVVLLPCGFSLDRTLAESGAALAGILGETRAGRVGAVFAVDGNQLFNRPGPRLADSLEVLGEILHPEAFDPAGRGRYWDVADALSRDRS